MRLPKKYIPLSMAAGIKKALALACCLSLLCSCSNKGNLSVIVAGSTSVQPYAEILAEEFAILYPGSEIDVQGGGSSAGIQAAETRTADIGMSSRHLKESEEAVLHSFEIAKDGLAMIVHPDNPLDNLSLDDVRAIYAQEATLWSDMGGNGHKIHLITREEGSGTRSAFEELVMGTSVISPKAIVQDSNGAVKQLVSNDRNSIGFISLGLVDGTVKALKLDGSAPSIENVLNGTYNLHRPFIFVTSDEPQGEAKEFIDFVMGQHGQELLAKEGLIPPEKGD